MEYPGHVELQSLLRRQAMKTSKTRYARDEIIKGQFYEYLRFTSCVLASVLHVGFRRFKMQLDENDIAYSE